MTEFNNRVRDSVVVTNLRQANATLAELSAMDWEHQTRVDLIHRLSSVGKDTIARLSTNRELIAEQTLNNLSHLSQEFLNWVNNIAATSTDDDSYRYEASIAADNLLLTASSLPPLRIRTTNEIFERATEQFDHEMQSSVSALSNRIAEISAEFSDMSNRIDQNSTQFNERTAQLEARLTEATERLEREVTSTQEVFRESQRERDEEFTSSQDERNKEFHSQLDPIVADVNNFRTQARSMLEEVAGAGTAEHYVGHSQEQNKAANIWRWIGVGALFVMALASVWVFYESSRTEQDFFDCMASCPYRPLGIDTHICCLCFKTVQPSSTAGREYGAIGQRTATALALHESTA